MVYNNISFLLAQANLSNRWHAKILDCSSMLKGKTWWLTIYSKPFNVYIMILSYCWTTILHSCNKILFISGHLILKRMSKFQENMDRLNKDKNYHFKEYSGNFEVCSPLPETSRTLQMRHFWSNVDACKNVRSRFVWKI